MANSSGVKKPVLSRKIDELSLSDEVLSLKTEELHLRVRTQSFSLSSSEKSEAIIRAGRASRAAGFLYELEEDEDELVEDEEVLEDELFELLLGFNGDDNVLDTVLKAGELLLTVFTAVEEALLSNCEVGCDIKADTLRGNILY